MRNGRPGKESWFNLRVVGTIVRNSPEIQLHYRFSEMGAAGSTAASGLKIKTMPRMPKSRPSTVRFAHGGKSKPTSALTYCSHTNSATLLDATPGSLPTPAVRP